MTPKQVLIH